MAPRIEEFTLTDKMSHMIQMHFLVKKVIRDFPSEDPFPNETTISRKQQDFPRSFHYPGVYLLAVILSDGEFTSTEEETLSHFIQATFLVPK